MRRLTLIAPVVAVLIPVAVASVSSAQPAAAPVKSCKERASEKKLAGAALKSFSEKCAADAKAACEGRSAEKKLHGAAKNSFETKCLRDATGS
jgi:hypothetical protein